MKTKITKNHIKNESFFFLAPDFESGVIFKNRVTNEKF